MLRRYSIVLLLGAWCPALTPTSAVAWGANGHRITAEIAQRHLNAAAQAAIRDLIGPRPLALLATWPDDIRSDDRWDFAKPWHFATIEDDETYADTTPDPKGDVIQAIERFTKILQGDKKTRRGFEAQLAEQGVDPYLDSVDATALAFLIHFVGDVHQPLHVGRGDDLGGNTIRVAWFNKQTKLHSVWDTDILEGEKLSFSDFAIFIDVASAERVAAWQADPLLTWAGESQAVRGEVYDFGEQKSQGPPQLSYAYQYKTMPIVKARLLQGGVRLAGVLNQLFK